MLFQFLPKWLQPCQCCREVEVGFVRGESEDESRLHEEGSSPLDSLLGLWRDGALFGATPDQAFYVKCDAETNPPDVVDAGQVVIEIGIAPVKPAEFVVFRIQQLPSGGGVNE